jgi:hypothetical protein
VQTVVPILVAAGAVCLALKQRQTQVEPVNTGTFSILSGLYSLIRNFLPCVSFMQRSKATGI